MMERSLYVETEGAQLVRTAIEMAGRLRAPSLVTGAPGVGKTVALRHIGPEFRAIYCAIDQRSKDVKGMYLMLIASFRQVRHGRYKRDFGEQIYGYLRRRYRESAAYEDDLEPRPGPLFVDEYQNADATTRRELLNICEECAVPLIFAGNDERLARTSRADAFALEQIESRIGWRVRLAKPSSMDCRKIAAQSGVSDRRALDALATYGTQTTLRDLARLLQVSAELAKASSIEHRHVEMALGIMSPKRPAIRQQARA